MATATTDRLYFTDDDEANALLARDPLALLVGLALDQQVTVQNTVHFFGFWCCSLLFKFVALS